LEMKGKKGSSLLNQYGEVGRIEPGSSITKGKSPQKNEKQRLCAEGRRPENGGKEKMPPTLSRGRPRSYIGK